VTGNINFLPLPLESESGQLGRVLYDKRTLRGAVGKVVIYRRAGMGAGVNYLYRRDSLFNFPPVTNTANGRIEQLLSKSTRFALSQSKYSRYSERYES